MRDEVEARRSILLSFNSSLIPHPSFLLFLNFAERYLHEWQNVHVVLLISLKL